MTLYIKRVACVLACTIVFIMGCGVSTDVAGILSPINVEPIPVSALAFCVQPKFSVESVHDPITGSSTAIVCHVKDESPDIRNLQIEAQWQHVRPSAWSCDVPHGPPVLELHHFRVSYGVWRASVTECPHRFCTTCKASVQLIRLRVLFMYDTIVQLACDKPVLHIQDIQRLTEQARAQYAAQIDRSARSIRHVTGLCHMISQYVL